MSGSGGSKYADRLQAETYSQDTEVHFGVAEAGGAPDAWISVSERLVARLNSLGMAYELHHVPRIDIYDDTVFNSHQSEKLGVELEFLAGVVKDPALEDLFKHVLGLVKKVAGTSRRIVVSGN